MAFANEYEPLESCEAFFVNLKSGEYIKAWDGLTKESQKNIVQEVSDSLKKAGYAAESDKVFLTNEFNTCGSICVSYWSTFVKAFNPDIVLRDSEWSLGVSKKNYFEIVILYKESETPSILKMFREDGKWRLGLKETFWVRKLFM
ncbi:hypothetical protein [Seleniivibrio woodruffii]|uniref:DUF3828 domain-containing protein n=1 Tax=Seleniivibrio woodruffii TaxID=1078050 RepID=A0A4R1KEC1_9BACT|nr:hypothetical protein [Seleniivibrio woodruffii]TCK62343.1 hypothetical protein C8D98_0868 [Seleniivibrio woodruffii]TVZ34540.1 hypothetical protein OF66_0125 [Seleniivibrio woodruffii]